MIMVIRNFLGARSKAFLLGASLALVIGIGVADYLTGYHLSLGLFFVAPITLISWYVSRSAGFIFALLSASLWYAVNSSFAPPGVSPTILAWNGIVRFGFFTIISSLLASLKEAYRRQSRLARTDPLTGLLNSRAFADEARLELLRAARNRYEVAALYLDLDNFKALNDSRGHAAGDSLLADIGPCFEEDSGATDIIGRVGGDEFVVVLSGTSPARAQATATRLQSAIHLVSSHIDPPVSVTVGVVTSDGSEGIDAIIRRADDMMYRGKAAAKASIRMDWSEGEP